MARIARDEAIRTLLSFAANVHREFCGDATCECREELVLALAALGVFEDEINEATEDYYLSLATSFG
jgi:hypothetical protein